LARGIDAAAHEGALEAKASTFAVVGAGCDVPYPPEHAGLQARIEASGCVVSELPPGTPPRPWHFPARNRILAGLAQAVIVVQAEHRSGALITARLALHENREVMAVPGDVADPRSRGVHALLQQGAALVTCAGDVLRVLQWERGVPLQGDSSSLAADPAALLAELRRPRTPEALRARLQWSASRLQRCLVELELAGLVERDAGGRVRAIRAC
jgi:DNA processing protein